MVDVAKVNLYGHTMGYVRWDEQYDRALFEYDADFIQTGIEPSPLMMPARQGRVYNCPQLWCPLCHGRCHLSKYADIGASPIHRFSPLTCRHSA